MKSRITVKKAAEKQKKQTYEAQIVVTIKL